jgi:CMP-N-acetylneuraminic acid synthetase
MVTDRVIAMIPARGGSKRIPHKNIVDFMGQPLIAWTIRAALDSGLFGRVLVSTDDKEIARVAEENGVEVPFLRQEYADDHSSTAPAVISALEQVREHFGEEYDTVVQLMANCPLRRSEHILKAYENFARKEVKFQISCFRFGWMNPWWAVRLNENKQPVPLFPQFRLMRSQDLEELYCPTGAVWIADCRALKEAGTFYGPGHVFFPMDWKAAVDIDDLNDLDMAKALYNMEKSR